MTLSRASLLAVSLAVTPLAAACGDDPATIIDLTVVETLPVDFGALQGGVTEGAVISLDDLRDEPAYADAAGKLVCAGVDAKASALVVEALEVAAGATAVEYTVAVGPRGATSYTTLARFSGPLSAGETIALDSSKVTLDAAGLAALSQTVLGATPALDVQITATVPAAVDQMQLALKLTIDMSSDKKGCPSLTTGL